MGQDLKEKDLEPAEDWGLAEKDADADVLDDAG